MKVMIIVKASKASEAGVMPSTELLAAMGKFNEELVKAGIMLDGAGLTPSSRGARVHFSGTNRTVINGPFAETKELIAGYWVWKVQSLEEAIEWVKKCPNPMMEDSDIEIRPYFEFEDFGEALTPELREHDASLRAQELGLNEPSFQDSKDINIIGLNQRYNMESRIAIPQQWERFVQRSHEIQGKRGDTFYGVSWNRNPQCEFEYLTGVEVDNMNNAPKDFAVLKLPAKRYVVFPHTAHVSQIPKAVDTIWSKWAPETALNIDNDSPWFERYTSEFNPTTGMGGMEFWIPLA